MPLAHIRPPCVSRPHALPRRPAIDIRPLAGVPDTAVEALLDAAFGAGRRMRTAYRIRAGMAAIDSLSFAAFDGAALTGTIQCWPVELRESEAVATPLVMLGPVAVVPARHGEGIGHALMQAAIDAAHTQALADALMLIGDPEYYGRFGFSATCTAGWDAPGPVERHRLLAFGPCTPRSTGMLGPRRTSLYAARPRA